MHAASPPLSKDGSRRAEGYRDLLDSIEHDEGFSSA